MLIMFRDSSAVEQLTVNQLVVGSIPTRGAIIKGKVAEWFNAPVLKTGEHESVPWVQIPPFPPERV
jgi:hypothetical protein